VKKKSLLVLLLSAATVTVLADIAFDGGDAVLSLGAGTTFNYDISSPGEFQIGNLQSRVNTVFSGTGVFNVNGGTVSQYGGGSAVLLNAIYAPVAGSAGAPGANGTTITLNSGGSMVGSDNFMVYGLNLTDSDNILAGSLVFSHPITVGSENDVTLGLTSQLNQSVILDHGTLYLNSDLRCGQNVDILGVGTVETQGYSFEFGSYYNVPFNGTITWHNCNNVQLKTSGTLDGSWTFSGTTILNGNGATLDISSTGLFSVPAGQTLLLKNIALRGLTSSNFSILGTLQLEGATLTLGGSLSMTSGSVWVLVDSMVTLSRFNWSFTDDAVLYVGTGSSTGAATLGVNVIGASSADPEIGDVLLPSTINAPHPIIVNGGISTSNIQANVAAGNLVINPAYGVIAMTDQVYTWPSNPLGGEPIILSRSAILSPLDQIEFAVTQEVDCGHAHIVFATGATPQFIVDPGVTVTLSNVTFSGVSHNTFWLQEGATLNFGDNVVISFAEDVSWGGANLGVVGNGSYVLLTSDGPKVTCDLTGDGGSFSLGTNILGLSNIGIKGIGNITTSAAIVDDVLYQGYLALLGDARIDVVETTLPHVFYIYGLNNSFALYQNTLSFTGSISYEPDFQSMLSFTAAPTALSSGAVVVPTITFNGDEVMYLSTYGGTGCAYCVFDMPSVNVVNATNTSFVFGLNGIISGQQITLGSSSYPIVQDSALALVDPRTQFFANNEAGLFTFDASLLSSMLPTRHRLYQRMKKSLMPVAHKRSLSFPEGPSTVPNEEDVAVVHYQAAIPLMPLRGNVTLNDALGRLYTNFSIDSGHHMNLTVSGGVQIDAAATPITVKGDGSHTIADNDIINVVGGTLVQPNTINIYDDLTIDGFVMFQEGAVLCINSKATSAPVNITFASTSGISFGGNSALIISGLARLTFADGYQMAFNGNDRLIIDKNTTWEINDQTIYLSGLGVMQVQNGGQINLEYGAQVICGATYAQVTGGVFGDPGTYGVTLRAQNGGSVRIGEVLSLGSATSRLSFIGDSALDFSQGGRMIIAQNGVCECNALQGAPEYGVLDSIDFSNGGALYIGVNGKLLVDDNASGDGIAVYLDGASVSGTGYVGTVNYPITPPAGTSGASKQFIGQVQSNLFSKAVCLLVMW